MAQQDQPGASDTRQQQHTGNHDKPGQEKGGADKYGGTRAGAENVEPKGGGAGKSPDATPVGAVHTEEQSAARKKAEANATKEEFDGA